MLKNKWAWFLAIILIVGIAGGFWWFNGPIAISTIKPIRGPAIEAIYASGTVEPSVMLPIAPRVAGRLIELNVDEGDAVRKNQELAQFDDSDLSSTVNELAARARFARDQFQRTERLVNHGFIADVELKRSRADLDAAEAALKRAKTQKNFMALTAPANGLIIRRDGEIGQYIPAGQAIFYLSCCSPLRVTADVDEEDILRVFVNQKVLLRTDALPNKIIEGEVNEITPKGDPITRSYRVRIKLKEPELLKIGMTMDANLIIAERKDALLIPTSVIYENSVWVLKYGKLHQQKIKPGATGNGHTEVLEGITTDMSIVESPTANLKEGRRAYMRTAQTR